MPMQMIESAGGIFKCRRCHGWAFPDHNRAWGMPPGRPRLVCSSCGRDSLTRAGEPPPRVAQEREDPLQWEKLMAIAASDLAALERLRDDPAALERYIVHGRDVGPPRRQSRRNGKPPPAADVGVPAWLLPPESPAIDGQLAAAQLAFILSDNGGQR